MINFKDRIAQKPNVYTVTDNGDGTSTIVRADEPLTQGTPLNRDIFMDIQDWGAKITSFGSGTITDTYPNGNVVVTTFPTGLISRKRLTDADGDVVVQETLVVNGEIVRRIV